MVAHDLRCALQGVLGGVAALEVAALEPGLREQVERIALASRGLDKLLGRLFDDDAAAPDAQEPVDLAAVLRDITRRWSAEAGDRQTFLAVDAEADVPATLDVDAVALERALGNIICNALRHGVPGRLQVSLRRGADGGVVFVVRDGGDGRPSDDVDRAGPGQGGHGLLLAPGGRQGVVSAFAAPRGPGEDRGLGLSIIRRLSAEMGGVFALDLDAPGGGAEARLAFPAGLCGAATVTRPAPAPASGPASEALRGLRVLLAEDNPTNQMVATQMLAALGAEVDLSADGVEALQRFEVAEFDLVIVDIEMPRMSGLDVIRAIRGRGDARARVPIVAVTAYAMREHRERIAAAGANGLISKPITSIEAFGQALREHLAPGGGPIPRGAAPAGGRGDDDGAPVADIAIFDALCASIGMSMMAELLDKVVADLVQARADLAGATEPLDRKAIRSASHILISVAGAIGATRLQGCARSLNTAAHSGDEAGLPAGVRRCVGEIAAAVEFARSRRPEA